MDLLLDIVVAWPMPVVWLLAIALLLSRRRSGRRLFVLASVLLLVSTLPIVGNALLAPLSRGAVAAITVTDSAGASAIVVPTAGSFRDTAGRWWPQQGSVVRVVAGKALSERIGLPLIVVGGSTRPGQPAEAETALRAAGFAGANLRAVPEGDDSASSAMAVATVAAGPVILVTDASHIARMRAALRHAGIPVALSAAVAYPDRADGGTMSALSWRDFVPAYSGLRASRAALREYVGIAWYLVCGKIGPGDL